MSIPGVNILSAFSNNSIDNNVNSINEKNRFYGLIVLARELVREKRGRDR